ncbi:AGAP006745-PA-like protein [Anopheles sinensis]|uniref:AGAP006745-PA-like protein n=1 Tax=Anopheles sinensis TaxID=74873 RepID=A0A084WLE4_ANOSI|nr:AGAP006745-PA-like protein [Anopheles sinensis]
MASNTDKDSAAVEINIESSSPDTPDAVDRATPAAPPLDTGRGRRLNAGTAANNNGRSRSNSVRRRAKRDTEKARTDAIPLLPTGTEGNLPRPEPPIAGPEFDDEDSLDNTGDFDDKDNRGIDSGFLDPVANGTAGTGNRRRAGRRDEQPRFPFAPGFAPDGTRTVQTTEGGQVIPDVNVYQQKKNLAQGMMDLALLSANANQLRYVLESFKRHPYFYVNLIFISTSIIAQVAVGIMLIWKSRYNIKNENDFCKADRINNFVTIGIFIITIVNVLISAFGVAEPQTSPTVV